RRRGEQPRHGGYRRSGKEPERDSRAAAAGREAPRRGAVDGRDALPDDVTDRPGAAARDAGGGGEEERGHARRARAVRLRLRGVSLPRTGATLLAAVRGALSAAAGGISEGDGAQGAAVVAAVRLRR